MLDQKEPKNQERLIAQPRTRSGHPTYVATLQSDLQMEIKQMKKSELSFNYKGSHLGAMGLMPPGGDSAFLNFGSFVQAKERTKKKDRQPQVC